jgi:hypothetical protein
VALVLVAATHGVQLGEEGEEELQEIHKRTVSLLELLQAHLHAMLLPQIYFTPPE